MSDLRKDFLGSTATALFGITAENATSIFGSELDAILRVLYSSDSLNTFLDTSECTVCRIDLELDAQGIRTISTSASLTPDLPEGSVVDKTVVFHKTKPTVINNDNLHTCISVSTLQDSPIASLYNSIKSVYVPLLVHDKTYSSQFDTKLQSLLSELEAGLASNMRRTADAANGQSSSTSGGGLVGSSSTSDAIPVSDTNLKYIVVPSDEFQYWSELRYRFDVSKQEQDRANVFHDIFDSISKDYQHLNSKSMSDVMELLDSTASVVDRIWRATTSVPYPQGRMAHFLSLIADAIAMFIQHNMNDTVESIWTSDFSVVRQGLRDGSHICQKWISLTERLTSLDWQGRWEGHPHVDGILINLADRMEQVLKLRTVHEQLLRLLTADEQRDLLTHDPFEAFKDLQPLHYNEYTQPKWESAVQEYDRLMAPIEHRLADKLRSHLSSNKNGSPLQMLREFQRYDDLAARPRISAELVHERGQLVTALLAHLSTVREDFENRSRNANSQQTTSSSYASSRTVAIGDSPLTSKNLPTWVNNVVWVRQLINKQQQTLSTAASFLNNLPSFQDYENQATDLIKDMQFFESGQFEAWLSQVEAGLSDRENPLALDEAEGRITEIDRVDGTVRVYYSERLVTLLREVRALSALGYKSKIPSKINRAANTALKFYRHGVVLKQVANFYNTIHEQMIKTQKPMMLDIALQFDELLKNPNSKSSGSSSRQAITWDNEEDLERYINKLQVVAEKLTSTNRKLRKIHSLLTDKVVTLMNVDLLRQQQAWKDALGDIRSTITSLEKQGFQDMEQWKVHWDYQLYKALEHQYQLGLESLNENLPEIKKLKVQLVYHQRTLQFRPPFEEIRGRYYKEMKKFIQIPINFRGVAQSPIFKAMVDQNARGLLVVFKKAEELFARLAKLQRSMEPWVILASVDLDTYVEENLKTVQDWQINFKTIKQKGREAEKLPTTIKVDCITVNTTTFKTTIEDLLQRFQDALVYSLRRAASKHLHEIDEFMENSREQLSKEPQSIEEIGNARVEYKRITGEKEDISKLYDQFETKNQLLRSVVGEGVDATEIKAKWEQFDMELESHEMVLNKSTETLRAGVESRINAFIVQLNKFAGRWDQLKPKNVTVGDRSVAKDIVNGLKERRQEFDEVNASGQQIIRDCDHFNMPEPSFPELERIAEELGSHEASWQLYESYVTDMEDMAGQQWIEFRRNVHQFKDFVTKWNTQLKERKSDNVGIHIAKELDYFREGFDYLKYISGEDFKPKHWGRAFEILGMDRGLQVADLTFQHILDVMENLVHCHKQLKELNSKVLGERNIEEAIGDLERWGQDTRFDLKEHIFDNESQTTHIIREWKELISSVGDNRVLLNSIMDSPYIEEYKAAAFDWEDKLAKLDEYLRTLNLIQRKWLYLEPIFSRGALPNEKHRFLRVDRDFRELVIDSVVSDPRVVSLTRIPNIAETLEADLDQLVRCGKALADFLEEKRSRFPRFYFIGDEDLLEILGQAKNPVVIQNHLKKLFAGIYKVEFSESKHQIVAMLSIAGERVPLSNPVTISNEVESWLMDLSNEMKSTMRALLVQCATSDEELDKYPSQVLNVAAQIEFTKQAEEALSSNRLSDLLSHMQGKLKAYVELDTEGDRVMDLKKKALIMDILHSIDVIEQLQKANARSVQSWQWQKQLRYYLRQDGMCVIRMCDAEFEYTYEYQGNANKLVHTPLTDKCYLTLTQGMHQGYGGNPYGPAGTGKTESVKALGNAMGRQVLVFNCDEGIDFMSMGRIFTGLVLCGAWGCFDEFNRLEEDVLSAVSQQIQVIQGAIKQRDNTLDLLDNTIAVDSNAAIFVTMNPAGKGYGGRSKLPDNLKQLFRPVAMSAPDLELIVETILFTEGFESARMLAQRLVSVYTLCKQLLSPQQHYDWGLRALKSILTLAGSLIQAEKTAGRQLDQTIENELVVQALRVNTLSKLTYADAQRFQGLVEDIFPNTEISDIAYDELESAIKESLSELGLEFVPSQYRKMMQFHEACKQRMGCVIVGPSGSGKSTIWQVLKLAYTKMGRSIPTYTMNPKAMHRTRLLGNMDFDTREWTDGVLTNSARLVVAEPVEVHSWIICDGDIDPEWVESLNSVLDDNRLLTMPNGDRISFGPNVNFIFETHNLKFASPATISRMGMIFLSEEDMSVDKILKSWLSGQPENEREALETLTGRMFVAALDWVWNADAFVVDTTKLGLVNNGLSHLTGATSAVSFAVGLIRGLGANLYYEDRTKFTKYVLEMAGERAPDSRRLLDLGYDERSDRLMTLEHDSSVNLEYEDLWNNPMVNTVDVQRTMAIIQPWMDAMDPFILVGPEGSGKTMILNRCFKSMRNISVSTMHCSAQTRAEHVIQKLGQACQVYNTNSGRVLRPSADRLVLYLKDLNLPKPDQYETVELVAFLQQLVTYKGYYDDNCEWVGLEKVQIVASMNPATTLGRHPLSTRFTSVVRICYMGYPEKERLQLVYSSFLETAMESQRLNVDLMTLAQAMVEVYHKVKKKFIVDDHAHYVYTPRDLTQWVLGLLRYDLETEPLLEVVINEAHRIFKDKLVDLGSKRKFENILNGVLSSAFDFQPLQLEHPGYFTASQSEEGDHTDAGPMMQRVSKSDYKMMVENAIEVYERDHKQLNVALFEEILDHVSQIDRAISKPGGSVLLVGRSGVGRQSALTIACHMNHMEVYTLKMGRGYSIKNFRADLKAVMTIAGGEGTDTVLFIEDHNIVESTFLESLNSLLSANEVPGLFSTEEFDQICKPLRELLSEEGFVGTMLEFFTQRVRRHLHVALGMDQTNPMFHERCQRNPALITKCSIQWFDTWTKESMRALPPLLIGDLFEDLDMSGRDEIVNQLVEIHLSQPGSTPRDYVSFLKTFESVFNNKKKTDTEQLNHLKAGLNVLHDAAQTVAELTANAEQQSILLAQKQEEANEAMKQIAESVGKAEKQRTKVEEIGVKLAEDSVIIKDRQSKVEAELSEIQPLIDSAREAVGQLDRSKLNEIKAMRLPPQHVRNVMESVLTLMGQSDLSWQTIKKFIMKSDATSQILSFEASDISASARKKVERLVNDNSESFEPDVIGSASKAAKPLAAWVVAMVKYSRVLDEIQPLTDSLNELRSSLEEKQAKQEHLKQKLVKLDKKVTKLQKEYADRLGDAQVLKRDLEEAQRVIEKASNLLGKLDGEKTRWVEQSGELQRILDSLSARAICASGFMTYLADEPEDVRRASIQSWVQLTGLESFDFRRFMVTESDQLKWKAEGLPTDDLSMDNGVVILEPSRVSFIIDPSTRATQWLIRHLEANEEKIEVTAPQAERFTNSVEMAVRFGKTLIVEEVDTIDPMLYPLLRRDLVFSGVRKEVQVGEKKVDYHEDFRMFLVTRNPSPVIPPDAKSLLAQVNFTVTRSGLEGQLLGLTLQHENPELETQKSELLRQEEQQKMELAELEKRLLEDLGKGNILENEELINSLNEAKAKSQTIFAALEASKELTESLDQQREVYRPIAKKGSTLFFLMRDQQAVNSMYQFSLKHFLRLFELALETEQAGEDLDLRISAIDRSLLKHVLYHVSRSVFKADRMTWGLHLVHGIVPKAFGQNEWELFTGKLEYAGASGSSSSGSSSKFALPAWAGEDRAGSYANLCSALPHLVSGMDFDNMDLWRGWARSGNCESEFPRQVEGALTPFQKVLVVQALRPDRLQSAMHQCACHLLRVKTLSPPSMLLEKLLAETLNSEPILIIGSPGADPSVELAELAKNSIAAGASGGYHEVAMGQGQFEIALNLLRKCAHNGEWLCLKNVHLVTGWLTTLEKEVNGLKAHDNFRLWLTSEPHDQFPQILLQSSLKTTYEAPPGIKKNLQRTYETWDSEFIGQGSVMRAQILFVLAWLHAVVQERRTYIPQGWSKFYEFTNADLKTAVNVIETVIDNARTNQRPPQWVTVHGLLENAIYGGRIDNEYDLRVLRTYLEQFFNNEMVMVGGGGMPSRVVAHGIELPVSNAHGDYLGLIMSLSDSDLAEFFSLPANIDRSVQRAASAAIINNLKTMAHVGTDQGQFDREQWKSVLGPLLILWDNLYNEYRQYSKSGDGGSSSSSGGGGGGGSRRTSMNRDEINVNAMPVETFAEMEVLNAETLMASVEEGIRGIAKVIQGVALITPQTLELASTLMGNNVPESWLDMWEGPTDPYKYLAAIGKRAVAVQGICANRKHLLKNSVNMADLFRPATFLNAVRQQTARVSKIALDNLKLVSSWSASDLSRVPVTVTVSGLVLQGCEFDGVRLASAGQSTPTYEAVPPVTVAFIAKDQDEPYRPSESVPVPLYEEGSRDKFITEFKLPCNESEREKWILSGTSLFLTGEY